MNISKLHYITSNPFHAEQACKGGADWIQLRIKNKTYDEWRDIALETKRICKLYNARFIINDNVQLAKEIKADGVHLGKEDISPIEAKKILGEHIIIGGTANTIEDILHLARMNVNYIGLGPFRFTSTKENLSPVIGINGYIYMFPELRRHKINIPIIAIGGIRSGDVKSLIAAGSYGIAVSSAISNTNDISLSTKTFIKLLT
jgi:thiamine-phosphate pyrophosphorylase